MASFWKHVNSVINSADIIIEVLDARMIEETRNSEIEQKVRIKGKKLLYVINKCDLSNLKDLNSWKKKLKPSIFVSSKDRLGTTMLKKKILEMSQGKSVVVGVLGYPNVGKSSVINALAGRNKARTSAESGFTKGLQKVRIDRRIVLLDTPGVFPYKESDEAKHARTGAIDYAKTKKPELAALQLIEDEEDKICEHYGVVGNDTQEILEEIAISLKKLIKGGKPDIESTARFILKEWQKGKI